ncbi:sugar ABC transporter permease [Propioniciclava soli]|uniref:Sugar ABC transporter permease n=2 Tax=Propioniciclava soli TaxID=2775081 RepID=A0ABZ3CAR0_9ACTN
MTAGLLFVLPMLVLFVMFRAFPALGAIGLSFTNYKLSGDFDVVGLKNYADFFTSEVARNALATTLLYAVIYVPLVLAVALGIALLLNHIVWGSGLFRSMMFLPYVTSFVLAGIIWTWLLSLEGPINAVVGALGQAPIPFLSGAQPLILTSIASASVWHGYGYSMLILLAGLKTIPEELYESARIDGATAWRQFRHITLPLLRPSLFFVLVIETIAAFQVFDTAYVMTGGGPARASYSLVYFLYDSAFRYFNFGQAAAVGVVLFAIVLVLSLVQRLVLDRETA